MITIHQPEHAPWLGFFDKIAKCDTYVVLDSVQFRKNYFQNRNYIGTEQRKEWVTVPVESHSLYTKIQDIKIANINWQSKYLNKIKKVYENERFFKMYYPMLEEIILRDCRSLCELNIYMLDFLFRQFNLKRKIVYSSHLGIEGLSGSSLILEICKKVGATAYLSGESGPSYLNLEEFKKAGIEVQINNPVYSKLSSLDYLFRYGPHYFN